MQISCVYIKNLTQLIDELKTELMELKADFAKATKKVVKVYTLGEWLNDWYRIYKQAPKYQLGKSQLYQIDLCIKKHIPIALKEKLLEDISPIDVEAALTDMESTRMAESTYDVYNEAFRKAKQLKFVSENIMDFVDDIKHVRKIGKALTHIEQCEYLEAISGHELEPLFKFYLASGCRRGEALALKWKDVSFEKKLLHIPGTKNKFSNRVMPLLKPIAEILISLSPTGANELVFPYIGDYVYKNHCEIWQKHTIRDLRHTFATRCFECGIKEEVYKLWLGHSKRSMVAKTTYVHVEESFPSEAQKFTLQPQLESSDFIFIE